MEKQTADTNVFMYLRQQIKTQFKNILKTMYFRNDYF